MGAVVMSCRVQSTDISHGSWTFAFGVEQTSPMLKQQPTRKDKLHEGACGNHQTGEAAGAPEARLQSHVCKGAICWDTGQPKTFVSLKREANPVQ